MKMKIGGSWNVTHIRDGETLVDFDVHNSITRRGAFDILTRFWIMAGINGIPGVQRPNIIPETEGSAIQDFISTFGWKAFFIEQEGDGVLGLGGDFDSGRGLHRDDRVRYWQQNTGNDLVPPLDDNREWSGDLHSIEEDLPISVFSSTSFVWTHYNDGIPFPELVANTPRNVTSMEYHHTYEAPALRKFRGIWWYQHRDISGFGQSSVVSSAEFDQEDPDNPPARIPRIIELHKCDKLQLVYKLSFTNI